MIWIIIEMEWYIFVQYCRDDEIHFTMEWITIEMEYAIGISSSITIVYEDDLSHDIINHGPYMWYVPPI